MLQNIIDQKIKEVEHRKSLYPIALLESSLHFTAPIVSLKEYILRPDKSGIIAEFKRKSPSKGLINPYANVERTTIGYMQAGASALSILTDEHFFAASNADLIEARKCNYCPILRKDFIIDPYQIVEARSIGADCILLIAAVLNQSELKAFTAQAHDLGMEVLVEIHADSELDGALECEADLIGVNNRNLKTMEVDPDYSFKMAEKIPTEKVKIAESGIQNPRDVIQLREAGYQGFLIGELFMRNSRPEKACQNFIEQLKLSKSECL
ncbi:MAG: indole-3-glycerol phosphate synthase TrpC [Flavobacteriales bacterium]